QVRRDDRAARASVVHGRSVPPRIQVKAAASASAVCELHRGQPPPQDPGAWHRAAGGSWHRVMPVTRVSAGTVSFGGGLPLALIAGPCVIESASHAMMIAESLAKIAGRCGVPFIFKAS